MKYNFLLIAVLSIGLIFVSCNDEDTGNGGNTGISLPQISITDFTKIEGDENNNFEFKVRLSQESNDIVSVDFRTEALAATENEDFISQNNSLSFAAREIEKIILIEIVADTLKEADEDFKITLSNAQNGNIIKAEGIGTIRNDDDFLETDGEGYITPLSYAGMELVWQDEFDGNSINVNDWNHEQGNHGWGNNELQNYTNRSENSFISNGKLIIEAREEEFGGSNFTSARMTTQGKQEFALGRIDIRAKLPKGQGIWPALWSLGSSFSTVGWPACGELDFMELLGHEPKKVHGTGHWGQQGQGFSQFHSGDFSLTDGTDFTEEFHVFSVIWETNSIKFLVDDNEYHNLNTSHVNGNYPFNAPFFFIFNIAVGGNWPGNPDSTTEFPQRMYVDYIRVFQ